MDKSNQYYWIHCWLSLMDNAQVLYCIFGSIRAIAEKITWNVN